MGASHAASGSTAADPRAERMQRLAASLRVGAARAADVVRSGAALVFVASRGSDGAQDLRLRAAAGFGAPEQAREAATALQAGVQKAIAGALADPSPIEIDAAAAMGARSAGGALVLPLVLEGHSHGALVVGSADPFGADQRAALGDVALHLATSLDHARLLEETDAQGAAPADGGDRSDEILKLSEALFAQDIELLRNNEKLGKIEKLKNDFIEKMSRELRTPLNSIIESIISVLTGENESLSESAKATLRSALDDGSAFLRTLQNILDLWRIKQGELPVEIQDVNFREIVDEAIFSVQDTLGNKPVQVLQHFEEPFPKIRTDLAKINQLLFLLLDNAVKFTERGKVTISARLDDSTLVCEVKDSGIGICPDDRQFIFDEFYQVDESGSPRYRGSGLGLTLVRDLIVLLEGEVSLDSEVGQGTTVVFRVPIHRAD